MRAVAGPRECEDCSLSGFAWSRDGTRIAFEAHLPGNKNKTMFGIAFARPDGQRVGRLLDASVWDGPLYSPDGKWLAWSGSCAGRLGRGFAVCVAAADGTRVRDVSSGPTTDDYSATWSPESRSLAFVRCRRECPSIFGDIYTVPVDGSSIPAPLTGDGWDGDLPGLRMADA